jgi:uncharacterized protein (DUF433 family)
MVWSWRTRRKSPPLSINLAKRIATDPNVMAGKPCVRGTRITVEHILRELAGGLSAEDLMREHPRLTREDVHAAQLFAADYLARKADPPRHKPPLHSTRTPR